MMKFAIALLACSIVIVEGLQKIETDTSRDLNIVVFFTHIDPCYTSLKKNILKLLHLHEATSVKNNCEREATNVAKEHKSGPEFCKELLKENLMSLIHYCHTIRKMKTAVVSVSSNEMTNAFQDLKKNQSSEKKDQKCEGAMEEGNEEYISPAGKPLISGDKHTEVFQIRARRSLNNEKKSEEALVIKRKFKPAVWDIFDMMKHVRHSFLGGFLDNGFQSDVANDQENLIDVRQLGKQKQDPELFSVVKTTLDSLVNPPETPFLMAIFGGHLHLVTERHSPIVQSIKYVLENTESEKTLIVVTGPNFNILAECNLLHDIPLIVRKILELHSA